MTTGQPWNACMTMATRRLQRSETADAGAVRPTPSADPKWLSREAFPLVSRFYELTPAAHARIVEALVRELDLPKFSIVAHFPQEGCPDTIVRIVQLWLQRRILGARADPWWSCHTADLDSPARTSQ